MANNVEVVNLEKVQEEVTIGIGSQQTPSDIYTYYSVKPPLSEAEHQTLIDKLGTENKVGQIILGGMQRKDEWQRLTIEGGLNQEHVELGIELASEIIALRGLRSGRVMAIVEEEFQNYFLFNKSESEGEDLTVIDAEEFAEAQRDPKFRAFAKRAREYGERQEAKTTPEEPTTTNWEFYSGGLEMIIADSVTRIRIARELREEDTEASIERAKKFEQVNDDVAFILDMILPRTDGITWIRQIKDLSDQPS